jgi:diacylglycerol kinase family enzyme
LRVSAILHPYESDSCLAPFQRAGVDIFRGNHIEPSDLPDAVIVVGGDGSVHRILSSLAETSCPLLVVPAGSGNDFAHAIGIYSVADAIRAWDHFVSDPPRSTWNIDLGLLEDPFSPAPSDRENPDRVADAPSTWTFADKDGRFQRPSQRIDSAIMQAQMRHVSEEANARKTYFCCIAGIGLDAEANRMSEKFPRSFRRHGGYSVAALTALLRHQPQSVTATLEDGTQFSGPSLLCAFGNAQSYGGGLRMLPAAKLDDQLLDICFVQAVSKLTVLRKFHTIYSGNHRSLNVVRYAQSPSAVIDTAQPMPIYADGEFVGTTPVRASVVPRALKVIAGIPPR